MEITTEYNSWFIVLCIVLAGLYTFLLYRKSDRTKGLAPLVLYALGGLRFVTVFILALLLLNPLFQKWETRTQKPIIILAQDNSESILNNRDSVFYKTTYLEELEKLKKAVSDNYELVLMPFGGDVQEENTEIDYHEKRTNYARLFDEVDARYAGDNIGGLILATDGLYNIGANPAFYNFKQLYPIYTVGLGDTSQKSDIAISEILSNDLAYLGNQYPMQVSVHAKMLQGKKPVLSITKRGKVIAERTLDVGSSNAFFTEKFIFTADEIGTQRLTAAITTFENELNVINNSQQILVDVIDNRDKVLILANAPHPDIAAIRSVLEKKDNIEVEVALIGDINKVYSSYNLIIGHGFGNGKSSSIWNKVWESKVPLFLVLDANANLTRINSLGLGFTTQGASGKTNTIFGGYNNGFNNFKISSETKDFIQDCPPLTCAFGEISGVQETQVLLYQKLGTLVTEFPLVYFGARDGIKTGWLFGEGLWKWKMFDYRENDSFAHFDELLGKTVQFLSVKEDKSRFRININNRFSEGDNVKIKAEYYDKSYVLSNELSVGLRVINENKEEFNYEFNAVGSAYEIDLGKLQAGIYEYEAKVSDGVQDFLKKGVFVVHPLNIEWQKVSADFNILQKLSAQTQGAFYTASELLSLVDVFNEKDKFPSISYTSETKRSVMHEWWIFFLILSLLTIEWVLRKYKGRY